MTGKAKRMRPVKAWAAVRRSDNRLAGPDSLDATLKTRKSDLDFWNKKSFRIARVIVREAPARKRVKQ